MKVAKNFMMPKAPAKAMSMTGRCSVSSGRALKHCLLFLRSRIWRPGGRPKVLGHVIYTYLRIGRAETIVESPASGEWHSPGQDLVRRLSGDESRQIHAWMLAVRTMTPAGKSNSQQGPASRRGPLEVEGLYLDDTSFMNGHTPFLIGIAALRIIFRPHIHFARRPFAYREASESSDNPCSGYGVPGDRCLA